MKPARNKLRSRALNSFFAAVGLALLLGISMPVWFPWVLAPVLRAQGIRFASHDRHGYSRLVLRDVQGRWNGTTLTAAQVDLALPPAWFRQLRTADPSKNPVATIRDWSVRVTPWTAGLSTNTSTSTFAIMDQVSTVFAGLRQWVPAATATNGTVVFGQQSLAIASVQWKSGLLDFRAQPVVNRPEIEATVELKTVEPMQMKVRLPGGDLEGRAVLSRSGELWKMNGDLTWRTNQSGFEAEFASGDRWPRVATMTAAGWMIPGDIFALKGYGQPVVSATFNWTSNHFVLGTSIRASAADAKSLFPPPIELQSTAHGDLQSLVVDQVKAIGPGMQAVLADRADVIRDGRFVLETAAMRLTADLAQLPFAPLAGIVSGDVVLRIFERKLSDLRFSVAGADLRMGGVAARSMRASGGLVWPELSLDELKLQLDESSSVNLAGRIDLLSRSVTNASWRLAGPGPRGLFPDKIRYDQLTSSGNLGGPLTNLTWSGEVAATQFSLPGVKPAAITVSGRGEIAGSNLISVTIHSGGSTLGGTADVTLRSNRREATEVRLTSMNLARDGGVIYSLAGESLIKIQLDPDSKGILAGVLSVDTLAWRGQGKSVDLSGTVSWPHQGILKLNVAGLTMLDFADFLTLSNRQVQIDNLALSAGWSNGPVRAGLELAGTLDGLDGEPLKVGVKIRMTEEGIEFDDLSMAGRLVPVLTWQGRLPIVFSPAGPAGLWQVNRLRPSQVRISSAATAEFGLDLKSFGKLQMGDPRIELNLEGTLEKPVAELVVRAHFVVWRPAGTNDLSLPRLDDFKLRARVQDQTLKLLSCTGRIDGQPVLITGEWPLSADSPTGLFSAGAWLNPGTARGRLEMKDVQAAPLARYWPKTLAPQGRVNIAVEMLPGPLFEGVITVTNSATRGLGPFTPIRDISAVVRLSGKEAHLESCVGQIGGRSVRMTGRATLPIGQPLQYEGNLTGTNVSLARSTGFLLRSDFDLHLVGGGGVATVLSGDVVLRDGLYVQNIGSLLREGSGGTGLRPPYFSVTDEPFAGWKLDARIRGDQFLRMRTPVFSGVISGDFKLQGTMAEPVLIGDARTTSGRILFPFGSLEVGRAQASFASNDQDGPLLSISASGMNYRYEIRLDINGPMNGANVMFNSTPPLSSERILLMLTAGELPEQEYVFSGSSKAGRIVSFLGQGLVNRVIGGEDSEDRLIIRSGENLTVGGNTTYYIEYKFADRWSVVGEYDRFGAYNAGLKWKVYSR